MPTPAAAGVPATPAFAFYADPAYCFSDAAGTVPCGIGDPVYVWKDFYAGGNDFAQATSASRPTLVQDPNGYYCVLFDGVDDFMDATGLTGSYVDLGWAVNRLSTTGAGSGISTVCCQVGGGGDRNVRTDSATKYRASLAGVAHDNVDGSDHSSGATGDFRVGSATDNTYAIGTAHTLMSVQTNATSATFGGGVRVGRNTVFTRLFNGRVYGTIAYTSDLTDGNKRVVEAWLTSLYSALPQRPWRPAPRYDFTYLDD